MMNRTLMDGGYFWTLPGGFGLQSGPQAGTVGDAPDASDDDAASGPR